MQAYRKARGRRAALVNEKREPARRFRRDCCFGAVAGQYPDVSVHGEKPRKAFFKLRLASAGKVGSAAVRAKQCVSGKKDAAVRVVKRGASPRMSRHMENRERPRGIALANAPQPSAKRRNGLRLQKRNVVGVDDNFRRGESCREFGQRGNMIEMAVGKQDKPGNKIMIPQMVYNKGGVRARVNYNTFARARGIRQGAEPAVCFNASDPQTADRFCHVPVHGGIIT